MQLTRSRLAAAAPGGTAGVTSLELFFDLVFVYTITQVTAQVRTSVSLHGYLAAAGILVVTWWMYDGYAWLANNVGPTTVSTRLPMLVAMTGFLMMAVAIPDAYDLEGAWPFAIAYTAVVVVHGLQFGRSSLGGSAKAILRVLPLNLLICVGLYVAAVRAPSGHARDGWIIAVAVIVVAAALVRGTGFTVRPVHFAERHQLLVMIALGETVVSAGYAGGSLRTAAAELAMVLMMVLLGALWWTYFGSGDDVSAGAALASRAEGDVPELAFWGYSMGHLVHIGGLVLLAAGLQQLMVAPRNHLSTRWSLTLAVGVAIFLAAEALLRKVFRVGSWSVLIVAAVACAVIGAVGRHVSGLVELELLSTTVVAALVAVPSAAAEPGPEPVPAVS